MAIIRDQVVILSQLAHENAVLEGLGFENCTLVGPMALFPLANSPITKCEFDAPPDAIFVSVPEGQPISWAVGLRNSPLTGCKLRRVAIIGTPADVARWKMTALLPIPDPST